MIPYSNIFYALLLAMPMASQDVNDSCNSLWQKSTFIPHTKREVIGKYQGYDRFSEAELQLFLNDSVFFNSWSDIKPGPMNDPLLGIAGTFVSKEDSIIIHFTHYVLNNSADSNLIALYKKHESHDLEELNSTGIYVFKYVRTILFLAHPNEHSITNLCDALQLLDSWPPRNGELPEDLTRKLFRTRFLLKE